MSVLFINEENLPRVDALVVTETGNSDAVVSDVAPVTPTLSVPPMDFVSNSGLEVVREVRRFLTAMLEIAAERGYTSVAMPFPAMNNRKLIYEFLNAPFIELTAGFDIDIYIIVDGRQKRMMRASLGIEDIIEPVMYCRSISACESAKPQKKATRPRPYIRNERMDGDACLSVSDDDFFDEPPSLADFIRDMDDTFAVRLLKLIDMKEMNEVECYKAANVSRQTWYKIMNEKDYRPSKNTVICFAIALHLTYDETQALLATAGYILSGSILFDRIIAYCIREGNYDIFSINAMLYSHDAECLGA